MVGEATTGDEAVIVTMFEDDATVFTAMRAAARAYVLKDGDKEDVLGAPPGGWSGWSWSRCGRNSACGRRGGPDV